MSGFPGNSRVFDIQHMQILIEMRGCLFSYETEEIFDGLFPLNSWGMPGMFGILKLVVGFAVSGISWPTF